MDSLKDVRDVEALVLFWHEREFFQNRLRKINFPFQCIATPRSICIDQDNRIFVSLDG